jgi:hypothetical protein
MRTLKHTTTCATIEREKECIQVSERGGVLLDKGVLFVCFWWNLEDFCCWANTENGSMPSTADFPAFFCWPEDILAQKTGPQPRGLAATLEHLYQ